MSKIYSRRRFILKPIPKGARKHGLRGPPGLPGLSGRYPTTWIIKKRTLKIVFLLIVIILAYQLVLRYVEPVFETLCEEKVKSVATIISNQESTKIMNKYQYEELYTIERDEAGNITVIKSNVVPINNLISDLAEGIQNRFDEIERTEINIRLGNFFGNYFFSGLGPAIPAKVAISGTMENELKSEFIAKGINQTLHRLYVNFDCKVKILTPIKNYEKQITNQVLIAEHVIVGNIPDTYYNLEGMDSTNNMLDVIN